jgi:lipopolysaccharide transport system ATP-binding protein
MSDIVIKVENLSKQYQLGQVGTGTLRRDFERWFARIRGKEDPTLKIGQENVLSATRPVPYALSPAPSEFVWALRDINFEVRQGEVLGIIGKNGAGKSTLLKILSQVTSPTTGQVKVKGRIASLLEIGTGFHPDLTGRENIFLNGAILGMTKNEIRRKFDEIVDFSGVERYIDTPVKRYSSGMYVRLAFAVAAHLEPEILVIDEVLAVGDAEFQKKALGKMQEVSSKNGRTVLFVSHNMTAVKNLCTGSMVLSNGDVSFFGGTGEGIDYYLNVNKRINDYDLDEKIRNLPNDTSFKLNSIKFTQKENKIIEYVYSDLPIDVEVDFLIKEKTSGFRLFIDLVDNQDTLIFRSFFDENESVCTTITPGIYKSNVQIPPDLLGPMRYEVRLQAGIYNQRMCIPMDEIKVGFYVENMKFNQSYLTDTFRQKIAPILHWETIRK